MPIHQQGGRIQNVCVRQQNVCVAALEKVLCYRCSSVVLYALALVLHLIHVHTLCSVVYESRGESVGNRPSLSGMLNVLQSVVCTHTEILLPFQFTPVIFHSETEKYVRTYCSWE